MTILPQHIKEFRKVLVGNNNLGRLIFLNLKKAIKYSLSHIIPEVLPYFLYVVVPLPLALTSTQILMIDLGFELFLTLSYSWEPAEGDDLLMCVPPRKPVTKETTMELYNIAKHRHELKISRDELKLCGGPNSFKKDSLLLEIDDDYDTNSIAGFGNQLKSRYGTHVNEMKSMLTQKYYWKDQFNEWKTYTAESKGERLVDGEVMLWSYIEAGIIEFVGSLCTYFAIFWFSFGVSADDARIGQIIGSKHWKPQSPDIYLSNGEILVFNNLC